MTLQDTARKFMTDRKGVLASDESTVALEARFDEFQVPNNDETHRAYYQLLFSTPSIEESLSAVLISEDTLDRSVKGQWGITELIASKNILLAVHLDEDNIRDVVSRIEMFQSYGVVAGKQRLIVHTHDGTFTDVETDIAKLAMFARRLQEASILPIIGVEITTDGPLSAAEAESVLTIVLGKLHTACEAEHVKWHSVLVESSMAGSGAKNEIQALATEVAERTLRALSTTLTAELGGVLLFSNEESPEIATKDLNAIARLEPFHWPIAFCFSRALQDPVLTVWQGNSERIPDAQAVFKQRLFLNSTADAGGYSEAMESR
ncbi:fructose-bisphosphate aldolase class I [Patescibacteria group bacterium]|nr:MAG: fructose-bisphosphate aldolase class I [Patescibacteria group bacterium]